MYRMMGGALLVVVSAVSLAAASKPASNNIISGNVGPTLPSAAVETKVHRLADQIHWHTSLSEAKYQAQKENKPIFWIHVLGDLEGSC